MRRVAQLVVLSLFLGIVPVSAGEAMDPHADRPKAPHKWREILSLVGGASGFLSGTLIGLSAFDDAINSDRKLWTTAIVGAIGGGVAGYFLGKHMEEGGIEKNAERAIEDGRRSVQAALLARASSDGEADAGCQRE